jgi:hypothetical protein
MRWVAGLPGLPRMDLAARLRRTMSWCHRRIVSGVTGSRASSRRDSRSHVITLVISGKMNRRWAA